MTKAWYRQVSDGQRGYLEERDGVEVMVFDRANQEITRRFDKREETRWVPDPDHRPLNRMAIAQAAFAADAVICRSMGMYQKESDWLMLRDAQRIAWMRTGPQSSYIRRTLYEYVMAATEHLTEAREAPPSIRAVEEVVALLKEERDKPGRKPKLVKKLLEALDGEGDAE